MQRHLIRAALLAALATLGPCQAAAAQTALEREKIGDPDALATIVFDSARPELSERSRAVLDELVAQLGDAGTFEIVGHADATGKAPLNQWLSEERAKVVRRYLVSKGIDAERLIARGQGARDPIDANSSPEGRARNRRVDVKPAK